MDAAALGAHEHLGLADGPRLGVDLLAEKVDLGGRIDGLDVVDGGGEHAAGAAGWVEDVDDLAFAGDGVGIRGDEQVDHELDDFAGGEVLAGCFVGVLGEVPDQVLEDVTHVVVGQLIQVAHLGEATDYSGREVFALASLVIWLSRSNQANTCRTFGENPFT